MHVASSLLRVVQGPLHGMYGWGGKVWSTHHHFFDIYFVFFAFCVCICFWRSFFFSCLDAHCIIYLQNVKDVFISCLVTGLLSLTFSLWKHNEVFHLRTGKILLVLSFTILYSPCHYSPALVYILLSLVMVFPQWGRTRKSCKLRALARPVAASLHNHETPFEYQAWLLLWDCCSGSMSCPFGDAHSPILKEQRVQGNMVWK